MFESHSTDAKRFVSARTSRVPAVLSGVEVSKPQSVCRILLVCDSTLLRHVFTRIVALHARFEIVGNVQSPSGVLPMLDKTRADVVIFDEETADGELKATLRRMREHHARVGAILCQPLEERCSIAIAVSSGTADSGPTGADTLCRERKDFASEVRDKLLEASGFTGSNIISGPPSSADWTLARPTPATTSLPVKQTTSLPVKQTTFLPVNHDTKLRAMARNGPEILVIGCSTGGPSALTSLLPALPSDFPLPVLIVQHMPPHFTTLLAERLARICRIPVLEAENGMEVLPGVALVAPGDFHMRLVRNLHRVEVQLTKDELENSCRPAVDVLFRSVAEIYKGAVIATVLTGMGQDGLKGVRVLKGQGAPVFVQDRESSVVWGMPGAIAAAGLADAILPLEQITPAIMRLL